MVIALEYNSNDQSKRMRNETGVTTLEISALLQREPFAGSGACNRCISEIAAGSRSQPPGWLPASAKDIICVSSGSRDLIKLTTFACSPMDLLRLRNEFAVEDEAEWKPLPLDRRTKDILQNARETFADNTAMQFPLESRNLEYLALPERHPYAPAGHAVIIDIEQHRVWYIDSSM